MPDTQTPFPVGELWVMEADGGDPRRLASTDAGHGYAAAWSPEFDPHRLRCAREPGRHPRQTEVRARWISNIYLVNIATGQIDQVTRLMRC